MKIKIVLVLFKLHRCLLKWINTDGDKRLDRKIAEIIVQIDEAERTIKNSRA